MSCIIQEINPHSLEEAVLRLRRGEVIAVPTETVYGLVADAVNADAIQNIKDIKGREEKKPLQVLVPTKEWIEKIAVVTLPAKKLIEAFMPGALTLVMERKPDAPLENTLAPNNTIGVRMPDHEVMLKILREFAKPLAASSANPSGGENPVSAQQVAAQLAQAGLLILDGGKCAIGTGSTVVDITGKEPKILREGSISAAQITAAL